MFINLQRVFKFAIDDFARNAARGVAAIFVLVVTIFLVTTLFLFHGVSSYIISEIQNKIDITAYFKADAAEADILAAKDQIAEQTPDIKKIEYISKDDALAEFTRKHQGEPVFSDALNQVGDNPFLPSLNITTNGDASQYEKIAAILEGDQFISIIDNVDFSQKKATIDKVFSIFSSINRFGLVLAIILILIVAAVVFNTIKLAIDASKDEISTMRIVGASSWFVRTPFIIQGALFGLVAFLIAFFVILALSFFMSSAFTVALPGFSLWGYFVSNFWLILLIQLGFGVGLGVLASFIVVQKYLKI